MAVSRRCVRIACAVLVVLPLAACSKDSKRPTAGSASSSGSLSSASQAPLSTTTSTLVSAGQCDASPPPASAINVTNAEGDFNDDSAADTLIVYGTGTATQPSPYHVQIALANSAGTIDTIIADAATDNSQAVKALGGADITASAGLPPDGSGDEAFVLVGSGASDALVGVFQLVGCNLARLTGPRGTELSVFAIGGAVTHLDGLRCDGTAGGQRLVVLSATSNDAITYETSETRLEVHAGAFTVLGAPITATVDGSDPQLQRFSTLDCPGVQAP
ncbi:MAG: hypothetical protein QOD38_2248 [Acidimicrobiaceae bacterium]